ncbi:MULTISPECIES: penicillin-binding protein activator [unclassified Haematospirillum]|uniref:penicillin-binding protein activator n=1 Tax=unclassified Haematospirillum TaxID=2622088 RepID=UPI001439C43B|nr:MULTISPECIES: penicillin-binding protein activator [unclassified Haematospirillum]NKD55411.1 penicillin-binding protein activator [Haematospirillum sp. H4890]NKD75461.1 penicillin-binding protein activator [Haematospirillum sp. H4485]
MHLSSFPGSRVSRYPACLKRLVALASIMTLALVAGCKGIDLASPPHGEKTPSQTESGKSVTRQDLLQGKTKVAILVPLSGETGKTGESIVNAAQLALFDMGGDSTSLHPYDTAGTPDGARRAAERAITDGASILIGPLFSSEVKAIAPQVQNAGVPALTLTTDPTAAEHGIYVAGFLIREQATRVVSYAREQGLTRFAVLSTDTPFGRAMAGAYEQAVMEAGGTLVNTLLRTTGEDARSRIATLTSFQARVAERNRQLKSLENKTDPESVKLAAALQIRETAGALPFDALLMTSSGTDLMEDLALLASVDVTSSNVRMIGPMLWNEGTTRTDPALRGAWYPASPPAARGLFINRYQEAFGKPPSSQIASLGYDLTALAARLSAMAAHPGQAFRPEKLTDPSGFEGWDGLFRFRPDGIVERGLAVMEIQPAGPQVVSPAPGTFNRKSPGS